MRFRCLFGLHDWRIAGTRDVPTVSDENPMLFESGGVDYLIQCVHCSKSYVDRKRGFWIAPKFPPLDESRCK